MGTGSTNVRKTSTHIDKDRAKLARLHATSTNPPAKAGAKASKPSKATNAKRRGTSDARKKATTGKAGKKLALTAKTADKRLLYELAVQSTDAEIDFVDRTFKKLRGRTARSMREDFCASAATACEWVKRRPDNTAIGLDLDKPILDWGTQRNIAQLADDEKSRIKLHLRDVLKPGNATNVDMILAMNFSYSVFNTRELMLQYFRAVHASLVGDGVLFMDIYGGYESQRMQVERRACKGFTYLWEQALFHPITGAYRCHIHFEFPDKTRINRAFTYDWRLWSIAEIKDILIDAGFTRTTVYWEGDDKKGGGNGVFRPHPKGQPDACYVCYIAAEK